MAGSWRVAAALLFGAAIAAPLRAETIAMRSGGACLLVQAPEGTAAAAEAALEEAAEALAGRAGRLLADAAAMRMATAREAVPGFGAWAYSWVQSYVTSYRILARGAVSLVRQVAEDGEAPVVARLAEEMAAPIRDEFRDRVLLPALGEGMGADLAHVGAALDAAWRAALAERATRLAALPVAPDGSVPGRWLDFDRAAAPILPALLAAAPEDPVALIAEEGTDSGAAFIRSMRPMAARLGAIALRVSEAGSAVAAGGVLGFAVGGVAGSAVGVAGGVGLAWTIDWAFNRVDAGLNRAGFEAQALAAIGRAERRLAEEPAARAREALALRLAALRQGEGCP